MENIEYAYKCILNISQKMISVLGASFARGYSTKELKNEKD
jgi:hypothetical protein